MATDSLEQLFIPVTTDIERLVTLEREGHPMSEIRHATGNVDFRTAYDFMRAVAKEKADAGDTDSAIVRINEIDQLLGRMEESGMVLDTHTALMQILTALHVTKADFDSAMVTAAKALNLLAQSPKRKDEPFLSVLATLLYDIAQIHFARGEFRQAERDIEKSIKIFERLIKLDPERYESAHIVATNAATRITRSRQKQIEMLADFHRSVADTLKLVNSGAEEAMSLLIDSMAREGETLVKMGRQREGIQYYSRALKYLTRIEPDFSERQLRLSIALGEALLQAGTTREKGIHLLNTMLHKATKLRLPEEHRRIVEILVSARERSLDILGIWHKIFPR